MARRHGVRRARVLRDWKGRGVPLLKIEARLPGATLARDPAKLGALYTTQALRRRWDPRIATVETLAHWRAPHAGGCGVKVVRFRTRRTTCCGPLGCVPVRPREFTQAVLRKRWRSVEGGARQGFAEHFHTFRVWAQTLTGPRLRRSDLSAL